MFRRSRVRPVARRSLIGPLDAYVADIKRTPPLTAEEERAMAARVAAGDAGARDHMIRANLRLVLSIAHESAGLGLPIEDLVSEGNRGLIRAVGLFRGELGYRFSTYATNWIRVMIDRAITEQVPLVRIPFYAVELSAKAANDLAFRKTLTDRKKRSVAFVRAAMPSRMPVSEGIEDIPDGRAEPGDGGEHASLLMSLLACLDPGERSVIESRFGLGGHDVPVTQKEVGEAAGVTRFVVARIESTAMRKLRVEADRLGITAERLVG